MVAFANAEAVRRTLESGRATFFSRSRGELWEKGKTSGHAMEVVSVLVDCDADTLVYLVEPRGPSCHTGARSCFFRRLAPAEGSAEGSAGGLEVRDDRVATSTLLARLEAVIEARKAASAEASYVKSLLDAGPGKIGDKLREEADELARAVSGEDAGRVASEAADLLFHTIVALASRGVPVRDVLRELERRSGTSGHEEKRARAPASKT